MSLTWFSWPLGKAGVPSVWLCWPLGDLHPSCPGSRVSCCCSCRPLSNVGGLKKHLNFRGATGLAFFCWPDPSCPGPVCEFPAPLSGSCGTHCPRGRATPMTWERAVHKFPRFRGEGGVGACPFFSGTRLCRRGLSPSASASARLAIHSVVFCFNCAVVSGIGLVTSSVLRESRNLRSRSVQQVMATAALVRLSCVSLRILTSAFLANGGIALMTSWFVFGTPMLLRQLAGIRWAVSFSFIFLSGSLLPKRRSSNSASLSETGGPQSSSLSKEAAMSWKISSPPSLSPCVWQSVCTVWSGEGFSVSTSIAVLHDGLGRLSVLSSWGSAFLFPPIAPSLTFSLFSKQSIRFANFWTVSKIVASVSEEGLGIGDASMLFAGGAISSMSAGGWLFSVSVGDRVSSSKSRSLSVTECLQVRVVLCRWQSVFK